MATATKGDGDEEERQQFADRARVPRRRRLLGDRRRARHRVDRTARRAVQHDAGFAERTAKIVMLEVLDGLLLIFIFVEVVVRGPLMPSVARDRRGAVPHRRNRLYQGDCGAVRGGCHAAQGRAAVLACDRRGRRSRRGRTGAGRGSCCASDDAAIPTRPMTTHATKMPLLKGRRAPVRGCANGNGIRTFHANRGRRVHDPLCAQPLGRRPSQWTRRRWVDSAGARKPVRIAGLHAHAPHRRPVPGRPLGAGEG